METPTLLERYDAANLALNRIRILAGIQIAQPLELEETSTLLELIYEIARQQK